MTETESGEEPIEIPETDEGLLRQCRVQTFRSGGKGGQHQNVTDSGVRLVHLPTGVRAESRTDRSQHRNRAIALERLRRKLEQRSARRAPRIPTGIPETERRKRREAKRKRARLKALRRQPPADE
jgi:protein subunit release factor A